MKKEIYFKIFIKIVTTVVIIFILSCDTKREALGADNEIRVICSDVDKELVKEYLSLIFTDTIFTPEPEPYYYLKFSNPSTYDDLKSQAYVIIVLVDKNQNNSVHQLMKRILTNEQFNEIDFGNPMILGKDVFAKNQLFMLLNLSSKEKLRKIIKDKKNFIRQKFHEQFIHRQSQFIFGEIRNKDLENKLLSKYGLFINIPWGWELIQDRPDSNFIWLGKEMPFQWISINWEVGKFVENDLKVGDYLWKWPSKYYDYIQYSDYKFHMDKTIFGNNYAWRLKGVWETIDVKESKGGPFQSYLFYDQKSNKTFHINYLVYYPGKDKSIYMRQADLIVKSFQVN